MSLFNLFDRSRLPESLRTGNVSGILILGDVHGSVHQAAEAQTPLSLPWSDRLGEEPFLWLDWRTRLVPELVGREDQMDNLLEWAKDGKGVRARLLQAEGGMGKTRLAAELAQRLRGEDWSAGFARLKQGGAHFTYEAGTLVLVDYPEEHKGAVRSLFEDLAALETDQRLRVLLLSRHGLEHWQPEIDDADAATLFDARPLVLAPPPPDAGYLMFLAARNRVPRDEGDELPEPPSREQFEEWRRRSDVHQRPLFAMAAGVVAALEPEDLLVSLSAAEVVGALVDRELTRLRDEGIEQGLEKQTLPRLTALAAVAGGLDAAALEALAERDDELHLGLPQPGRIVDLLAATGRLSPHPETGHPHLPSPTPDLLAAALLRAVLEARTDRAAEWLWASVEPNVPAGMDRLGRLTYDAEVTLGLAAPRLSDWLREAVEAWPERGAATRSVLSDTRLAPGLARVATAVWRAALEGDVNDAGRSDLLNILSVHLAATGDSHAAHNASRQAVDISRRLARENPQRFEPNLAASLNNLSRDLAAIGKPAAALDACGQAADILRRLAHNNAQRFEPDLAQSLNNLSVSLASSGDLAAALASSRQAVDISRRLARDHPQSFEPDLAQSLNNLSVRLAATGSPVEALAASRQAADIRQRLARDDPQRFEPDLASSLINLSVNLATSDPATALDTIQWAADILRRLARDNPQRFEPGLALCLNNLSVDLAATGNPAAGLDAILQAVDIRRRLARDNPRRFDHDLAQSLTNLSNRLAATGELAAALDAIREAVGIRRRLARANSQRFEPELAGSLHNMAVRLAERGELATALARVDEAIALIAPHANRYPKGLQGRWHHTMVESRQELLAKLRGAEREREYSEK